MISMAEAGESKTPAKAWEMIIKKRPDQSLRRESGGFKEKVKRNSVVVV